MTRSGALAPARRDPRALDALAVFWVTLWLAVGSWVGYEVWQLSSLGTTLAQTGASLDTSGRALQELREVPVIGDTPGVLGDELRQTAVRVQDAGREARTHTRRLAVLLGVAVALGPSAPVLVLHLPRRLGWAAGAPAGPSR